MAAITNTLGPLGTGGTANVGAREDMEDFIYLVAPEATPLINNVGSTNTKAIRHEWLIESLATAVSTNAALEGDDLGTSYDAANVPTRISNLHQIFRKSGIVAGTQDALDLAGRSNEYDHQVIMKGKELKRDIEMSMIANVASLQETGSTARKTAGALAFITSNDNRGSGGSDGGFNTGTSIVDAATNGTQRTFTEALVKASLSTTFSNGGQVKQAYMGPTHKQQFSGFTGIADIRADVSGTSQATIYGAADVYVSDFGAITLIPHPYALTRDCLFIDPKMVSIGTLRGMKTSPMAKTGDAEKFMIVAEKCLIVKNQKSLASVNDLT